MIGKTGLNLGEFQGCSVGLAHLIIFATIQIGISETSGMAGREFKDNVDEVVEKLLKKLDKKVFMEVMPEQADKKFLDGLHSR